MSRVVTIPAPIGGINARDSFATMQPTDAVWLEDMIPSAGSCESSPPCEPYLAFPPGACNGLMPYEAGSTATLLGAFESGIGSWDIVDITNPSSTSILKAAQASGIYCWTMFQSKMILCNGANTPQVYAGVSCTDLVATGPTLANLRGAITFKGRVYYWEASSQSFWYAAAGAFQGTLTAFPIDTLTTKGGKITLLTTFTRDGGEGADDLFIIVLNTGEVIVYQGDDPSSAAAWEMIGRFEMPRPIGARSVARIGGNTLLLTYEGAVDLAQVLAGKPYPLLSHRVDKLLTFPPTLPSAYWDLVSIHDFPEAGSVVVNDLSQSNARKWGQGVGVLAFTKATGAWWTYAGNSTTDFDTEAMTCSCVWQGRTYFGFNSAALPVFTPMLEAGFYYDEVVSAPWYPVSVNGFAFSVSHIGSAIGKNYSINFGVSAYITPFGGLTGNATMVQPVVGTITNFWAGRDKRRWIHTLLRLKGGRR